jgi:hypothetical protein
MIRMLAAFLLLYGVASAQSLGPSPGIPGSGGTYTGPVTFAANPTGTAFSLVAGQGIGYTGTGSIQFEGSNTNDSACAGCIGEHLTNGNTPLLNATVTIAIGTPGTVTWTGHGLHPLAPVYFSTTGALPTGYGAFTNYWITNDANFGTNTFDLSTTLANAFAGTAITTSGTQSGTQTGHTGPILTSASPIDVMALMLNPGDYYCNGMSTFGYGGSTSVTQMNTWMGTAAGSSQPTNGAIFTSSANFQTLASAIVEPTTTLATSIPFEAKLSAAGMVVLSVENTYTVSSMTGYSYISCLRAR